MDGKLLLNKMRSISTQIIYWSLIGISMHTIAIILFCIDSNLYFECKTIYKNILYALGLTIGLICFILCIVYAFSIYFIFIPILCDNNSIEEKEMRDNIAKREKSCCNVIINIIALALEVWGLILGYPDNICQKENCTAAEMKSSELHIIGTFQIFVAMAIFATVRSANFIEFIKHFSQKYETVVNGAIV